MNKKLSWKTTLPIAIVCYVLSFIIVSPEVISGALQLLGFIVGVMAIIDIIRSIFKKS